MPPPFDWLRFHRSRHRPAAGVDSQRRLRAGGLGFLLLSAAVFGRMVQLEVSQGAAFREQAARPLTRQLGLDGVRGRILARNGTVLACDKTVLALAVCYRYLEEEPDPRWLRTLARTRLTRTQCKDPQVVAAEEARLRTERDELARRLAALCRVPWDEWNRRARQIEARVRAIAENVNRHRRAELEHRRADGTPPDDTPPQATLWQGIGSALLDALRASVEETGPERIAVSEELAYHVVVEDVPREVVAELEADPKRYPGVKIVERRRRAYPSGPLAAHVLGHLGPVEETEASGGTPSRSVVIGAEGHGDADDAMPPSPDDRVGRMGVERRYERLLRGRRGLAIEEVDRSGRVLSVRREREPGIGRDVVLTLDPQLQATAESLLDSALKRRAFRGPDARPAGGAIVVMDVRNGAILASASAPRFDPNLFAGRDAGRLASLLTDPAHPLFDRAARMAIPPGSVFKTVSAVALLEAGAIDPKAPFYCQGYLHQPGQWRCAIYRRQGVGHGELMLADALAESCNVYFFHHAGRLAPGVLADWATRFGFGRPTGIDLPGEAAGRVPSSSSATRATEHDSQAAETRLLAIGQGSLEVTPLQVARMMAAVANGGRLVTPHVVGGLGLPASREDGSRSDPMPPQEFEDSEAQDDPIRPAPPQPIPGLNPATLAAVREGLNRVVCDPRGTAHGTVYVEGITVAGKTGTAETGGDGDHAWFAGYVPAESPKLAFVVVLEHAGDAGEAVGPVAKRLVLRMQQLGCLGGADSRQKTVDSR